MADLTRSAPFLSCVHGQVAAATSATMIMFTAGSACLVYSRFGTILYDYAAVLVVLGFLVTLCSQLLTFMLIKLLGRRSIIVFMMVALMVSCLLYVVKDGQLCCLWYSVQGDKPKLCISKLNRSIPKIAGIAVQNRRLTL